MSYELELISLRCNDAQEGTDEPYLRVNNHDEWGPTSMRTGSSRSIGRRVGFDHDVNVELREKDVSRDDWIGTMHLSEADVRLLIRGDHYTLTYNFYRDRGIVGDANYTLTYDLHEA